MEEGFIGDQQELNQRSLLWPLWPFVASQDKQDSGKPNGNGAFRHEVAECRDERCHPTLIIISGI